MAEVTLLVVSPEDEDHAFVRKLFAEPKWEVLSARTVDQVAALARGREVTVVVVERRLGQGGWSDVWEAVRTISPPPMLIVTSRDADNRLWGEVLNLGGYDVLAKPLDDREVERVVRSAARRWQAEWAPAST